MQRRFLVRAIRYHGYMSRDARRESRVVTWFNEDILSQFITQDGPHQPPHRVSNVDGLGTGEFLRHQNAFLDLPLCHEFLAQGAVEQPASDRRGPKLPVHADKDVADGPFRELAPLIDEEAIKETKGRCPLMLPLIERTVGGLVEKEGILAVYPGLGAPDLDRSLMESWGDREGFTRDFPTSVEQ